jgi:hypothetical protein
MNAKKINKKATIQRILNMCNEGNGAVITDKAEFNRKVNQEDEAKAEEFIIGAASFCQVEVVYE